MTETIRTTSPGKCVTIDERRCVMCGACVRACPIGLFAQPEGSPPAMVQGGEDWCAACGHCASVCPKDAVKLPWCQGPLEKVPETRHPVDPAVVMDLIKTRRSVRTYRPDPVPRKIISNIIDTLRWAPTARNGRPVGWTIVNGAEKVRSITAKVMEWMETAGQYPQMVEAWKRSGTDMVNRGAPCLVLAHAPEDSVAPAIDCSIALSYFEIAAVAHGLGTCWAGILTAACRNSRELSDLLKIPPDSVVQGALMIGYSDCHYFKIPPRKGDHVEWV